MSEYDLVVGGAASPDAGSHYTELIRGATQVIAADSGAQLCRDAGRLPDLVVGDMDSIEMSLLDELESAGVSIQRSPAVKDRTDLELAMLASARDKQPADTRPLIVTAAFSSRLDHTLAAIGAAVAAVREGLDLRISEPGLSGWLLDASTRSSMKLAGSRSVVSVFGLSDDARVSLINFEYELTDTRISVLAPRGVSNELGEVPGEVVVHKGAVLVLSPSVGGVAPATLI